MSSPVYMDNHKGDYYVPGDLLGFRLDGFRYRRDKRTGACCEAWLQNGSEVRRAISREEFDRGLAEVQRRARAAGVPGAVAEARREALWSAAVLLLAGVDVVLLCFLPTGG
jgi:hypothetical protein